MPHVRELIPAAIDDILNAVKNKNIEYFQTGNYESNPTRRIIGVEMG